MKFTPAIEDPGEFLIAAGNYLAAAPVDDLSPDAFSENEKAQLVRLLQTLLQKNHDLGMQIVVATTALLKKPTTDRDAGP